MTLETEESHQIACQELLISGPVRCVTGLTALNLDWSVLENEWPLLVGVTLDARRVTCDGIAHGLARKPAVLVVTIAAVHGAFGNLVVEGLGEGCLLLRVTLVAEARLGIAQQEFGTARLM